ncbi:motility associated factor glycosyltransferase family protein [Clostridium butyricum]|uniref:motility associated factor glycosyltransferase family protein n=1 Tax=Clostridium butyricum TaxID=1492 RepID=UPI001FA91B2E|nr:6-hydroxymethylpterin diphosphokinase MptE-like protein [Clostridium butyricum]
MREEYSKNSILVLEPNEVIKKYAESLKWVKLDKNIKIFNLNSSEIKKYINEFNVDNININVFANYSKIYSEELKIFLEELKTYCINLKGNRTTKILFERIWFETLMENIPYIVQSIPANIYKNAYEGKPAIIVSAGPSLEKNIDNLNGYESEFLILTGARTLKGLLDRNIKPDIIAVLDPGEKMYKMVEDYIKTQEIPLFFYEGTNADVVKNHKGTKILSRYSHSYSKFIEKVTQMPIIEGNGGGSVAHYMTLHAVYMGCNPIIFIGQDLAYESEKKYSDFARIKGEVIEEIKNENDVYVTGINDTLVRSDIYLDAFRTGFENIINRFPNIDFINATEGGARIHGAIEMSLKDALKQYKQQIKKDFCPEYTVNIQENIKRELLNIKNECKLLKKLLKEIMKKIDSIEYENNEVMEMEQKADIHINNIKIFEILFYPVFYDVLSKKTNAFKIEENNIKYELEERIFIYKSIIGIIEYALPQVQRVLDILN